MKRSLKVILSALTALIVPALGWATEVTLPTPVYLLDAGSTATEGWTQINKNGSYPAFLQTDTTYGSVYTTSTSNGNFFNKYGAPANGFAGGTYVGLNGTEYTSVLAEMAASLGLESIPESVYSDNLTNGGAWGHTVTVNGLDASKTYVMYYIGGANKDNQTVAGFTLKSGGYTGSPKVAYVCTSGSSTHNTSTVTEYTKVAATTAMRAAKDGYLLVRVSYVQPTQSGTIQFTLSGERSNICALAIAEIEPLPEAITHNREINSADETWDTASEWTNGTLPVAADIVNLTAAVEGAILDIDTAAEIDQLTIGGDYALTVTGDSALTVNTSTAINTDVDVSGAKASLGAVTVVSGKTLTGSWNQVASAAGEGTIEVTADSTYTNSTIKNILITNGKLTSSYVSGGSGVASGRTITVDGAAEGSTAELAITVGDGTGYDNGANSKIIIKNGAKLCYGSRDTLNTAIELTAGKIELTANVATSSRALDFYNNTNSDAVADITVKAAEGATAEKPTVSYIDCLGTGENRALYLRRGNVEFNVEANAALDVDGYFVSALDGGSATGMKKSGDGVMILQGSDASTCATSVDIAAGTIKLCGASTLGTGAITVTGALVYNTSANAEPENIFSGAGTITADDCTVDFIKADLKDYTGTFAIANKGTLIIPAGKEGSMTIPTDGMLKLIIADDVDEHDASAVTIEGDGSLVFVNSAGVQITDGVDGKKYTRPVSTTPVCMGENAQYYTSIAAAIEAGSSFAILMDSVTEDVTLTNGFSLQTYGQTITGNVTVASGATLVAQAGGIVGTLTFEDGAAMTVEGAQDFTVSSTVTFPTSGTFNLTMPSAPVMGNSLPFIVSNLALADDDVKVGTLSFTVNGGTANTTDYKLISTSAGMYEVATVATPSCTLDGTVYGSLADAIAAVSADDYTGDGKITLSETANLTSTLTIDIGDENELTIDLNGKAISCTAIDAEGNLIPAIIVESGKLNLISGSAASVVTYTTTIVVGTETSTAPALVVGENVTVTSYGYGSATDVVKGSIGGSGALLTGGDTALTLAAGTTLDATQGTLTLSNDALLGATATVTVKVADTAKAEDVVITCDTAGLTADMFAVSGAENLGVAIEEGKVVLADATPAEPIVQIGDVTYTSLDEALNAIKDEETLTLLANIELAEALSIEKSITLAIGDWTLTIPTGTMVTVAAEKTLTVTCGTGGLAVDGTIAVNGTLDVSGLAYGTSGLIANKAGSLAIGATGTVKLMSSWNSASVNWMQANNPDFFKGTADGATILQGTVSTTYNGSMWLKADAAVTAMITANGQTYTEGFATLNAAAAANPSAITLLKDVEVTSDVEVKALITASGKTLTIKEGATFTHAPTGENVFQPNSNVVLDGGTLEMANGLCYAKISGTGAIHVTGKATIGVASSGAVTESGLQLTSGTLTVDADVELAIPNWNDSAMTVKNLSLAVDGKIVGGGKSAIGIEIPADATLAGSGEILPGVTLADGAIIDASKGALNISGNPLVINGTVSVTLKDEPAVGDAVIICKTAENAAEVLSNLTIENTDFVLEADGTTIKLATAVTYVAQVGETKYATLQAAYNAADEGATITLLDNLEAPGIKIEKSITLDLNDCTLTLTPPPVGSTGTETLGMQILQSTEAIIIKDGTIDVCASNLTAEKPIKMLIQNYSKALTLSNVTLDGTNLVKPTNMPIYVLSNNQGDVTIGAGTEIVAPEGAIAFDVCKYASYDAPTVTVEAGATIGGTVEVSGGKLDNDSATELEVVITGGGTITGPVDVDETSYEIKVGDVYCTAIVCDEDVHPDVAKAAAELFTGITKTYVDDEGDTVADIEWDFGISDIVRDGDNVVITAKVQKGDATAAGYAADTEVTLEGIDAEAVATGTAGEVTFTVPLTDLKDATTGEAKKLKVKASK